MSRIVLVAFAVFALSGCLRIEDHTHVLASGLVEGKIRVSVPPEILVLVAPPNTAEGTLNWCLDPDDPKTDSAPKELRELSRGLSANLRSFGAKRTKAVESAQYPGIIEICEYYFPPIDPQSLDFTPFTAAEGGGIWLWPWLSIAMHSLGTGRIDSLTDEAIEAMSLCPDGDWTCTLLAAQRPLAFDQRRARAVADLMGQIHYASILTGAVLEAEGYAEGTDGAWRWEGSIADAFKSSIEYRIPDFEPAFD